MIDSYSLSYATIYLVVICQGIEKARRTYGEEAVSLVLTYKERRDKFNALYGALEYLKSTSPDDVDGWMQECVDSSFIHRSSSEDNLNEYLSGLLL